MDTRNKEPLFIPKNFVETAQELQFMLATGMEGEDTEQSSREALRLLNDSGARDIAGSRHVYIHSMSAFVALKLDETTHHIRKLDELIVKGYIWNLGVLAFKSEVPTISIHLGGAVIKDPVFADDPNNGEVRGVLRVPVASVVSIWPAT